MEEREFTAYVVLRMPETLEVVTYAPGDIVPDWAYGQVGDHAAQGVSRTRQTSTPAVPVVTSVEENGTVTEIITPEYELADEEEAIDDSEEEVEDEEVEEVEPYDQWTKADLKAEAKGRELSGYSSASKEELVDLLEQDDAENME